ncbi:MAG TPA: hypothetical protein ENK18_11965 [Deltaproteobacteria bacterium]|nr:hypothetical protein [Deltaproteobacteria bacterium]
MVPSDPTPQTPRDLRRLLEALVCEGVLAPEHGPGLHPQRWVSGGFARLWIDAPGRPVLFANRQGGFSVHCPETGGLITGAFSEAWSARRSSTGPGLGCPACGRRHTLTEVVGRPPLAVGAVALVTSDAGAASLRPGIIERVEAACGPVQVVLRRG